ncbi:unnamed protein product [Cunninghamella blakesleeana]
MDTTHLYQLVGVQLDDFIAFETLVFGMLRVYSNTVSLSNSQQSKDSSSTSNVYDYRSPALRLSYDFQLAIKASHDRFKSTPWKELQEWAGTTNSQQQQENNGMDIETGGGGGGGGGESMVDILQSMLQEVSETADQLEKNMHQHNLQFSNGHLETVLKVDDFSNDSNDNEDEDIMDDEMDPDYKGDDSSLDHRHRHHDKNDMATSVVTLIDQDQNEYIMTRPFDTTIIYEDMQFLHDLILILVISFAFGMIFSFFGLPSFFGYILAGITAGPSGYNLIKELIQTETLAQLGVVLIVFVLGLECSLDRLKSMWRLALGGATLLLFITIFFFILMGVVLGGTIKESVFVGACISLSSTAVVVKVIPLDHLEHLYGLLVMQDVLLGFMLATIPALSKSGIQVIKALLHISGSFMIFAFLCYGIVLGIPYLLKHHFPKKWTNAIINNTTLCHESILLGALAICLLMSVLSEKLGLGMELGCFAAGVMIRTMFPNTTVNHSKTSTNSNHHHTNNSVNFELLLSLISPVRDLFACLFFASIGLHIYPSFLASELILLLTLTTTVMGYKYLVTMGILISFKFDMHTCSTMAVALAQISEFVFVLASRAKQLQIISREVYYLLLAVTALTLVATPVLWKLTHNSPSHSLPTTNHHHHH